MFKNHEKEYVITPHIVQFNLRQLHNSDQ